MDEATKRPWKIHGATIIWSPAGHSNVAAVSDPRPPDNTGVGYYEIRAWSDGNDAGQRFREACANAELIVRAVNLESALQAVREKHDAKARAANFLACGCDYCAALSLAEEGKQ